MCLAGLNVIKDFSEEPFVDGPLLYHMSLARLPSPQPKQCEHSMLAPQRHTERAIGVK